MSDSEEDNTQNDDLCDLLKCPVCLKTSKPPIFMCANGHHVCARCQPTLTQCPTCRAPGKPTARSLLLDKMAAKVRLPCSNRREGCDEELDAERMVKHWETCKTRYMHNCKCCKSKPQCNRQELIDHVRKTHPGNFFEKECNIHNFNKTKASGQENISCNILVAFDDELFWIQFSVFNKMSKASVRILYVGYDVDKAKNYECEFKYCTADDKPSIKCSFTVQLETDLPIDVGLLSLCLSNGLFPLTSHIIRK